MIDLWFSPCENDLLCSLDDRLLTSLLHVLIASVRDKIYVFMGSMPAFFFVARSRTLDSYLFRLFDVMDGVV